MSTLPSSISREEFIAHCQRISRKNNSLLYHLEAYLDKKLLSDEKLSEIRDIILTVSGDINRLPEMLVILNGDSNEKL